MSPLARTLNYWLKSLAILAIFPGAIVYYDGSHNDARMNISLAITSARHGANVANHVSVINLINISLKINCQMADTLL